MQEYEHLICSILRGDVASWPDDSALGAEEFCRVGSEHGVAALVYYRLVQSGCVEAWPGELVDRLHYASIQMSAVEMLRSAELQKVLDIFKSEGILPILIKGAALSHTHYPAPGLRQRCDTDLLIDVADIEAVQRIMVNCGYLIKYPFLKSHQFSCYRKDDRGSLYCFDIHWRISNFSRYARVIEYAEAVEQSVSIPQVSGACVLSNVHALALACVHLLANSLHDGSQLRWLYDIHLLVSAMSEDEQVRFANFAVERQIQDVCLQALRKSRGRFHTEMSGEVERILLIPLGKIGFVERFRQSNLGLYVDDLKVLPGFGLKVRLVKELLFPPPRYLLHQYGKASLLWIPVVYLWHIVVGAVRRLRW